MSCSEKQLIANRSNAQHSTGPKTVEGKENSRKNAVKHGMTAEFVTLDGEDSEALAEEQAIWVRELAPTGVVGARMAERAFRSHLRITRCEQALDSHLAIRSRNAVHLWEVQRAQEVHDAIAQLEESPAVAVARLQSTAEGCDWLASAWIGLLDTAERRDWNDASYVRACKLLGMEQVEHLELRYLTEPFRKLEGIHTVLEEHRIDRSASTEMIGKSLGAFFAQTVADTRTQCELAAEHLERFMAHQIETVQERAEERRPSSDRSRDLAPALVLFDPSKEGRLMYRYVHEAHNAIHRNLEAARAAEAHARAHGLVRPLPSSAPRPAMAASTQSVASVNRPETVERTAIAPTSRNEPILETSPSRESQTPRGLSEQLRADSSDSGHDARPQTVFAAAPSPIIRAG